MEYKITRMVLGRVHSMHITQAEFETIRTARSSLVRRLQMEEDYDILIENVLAFETSLLEIAARHMITGPPENFDRDRLTVDRHLSNALSSARMYIDHSRHQVSTLCGRQSAEYETLSECFSAQYDNRLGYRAMEALRNYVQHCGTPVQSITYGSRRERGPRGEILDGSIFTFSAKLVCDELAKDSDFKEPILQELSHLGKEVEIRPLMREYVEGLSVVNDLLRSMFSKSDDTWSNVITDTVKRYLSDSNEENVVGLAAISTQDGDWVAEEVTYLGGEIIERKAAIVRKHRSLLNFSKRQIIH